MRSLLLAAIVLTLIVTTAAVQRSAGESSTGTDQPDQMPRHPHADNPWEIPKFDALARRCQLTHVEMSSGLYAPAYLDADAKCLYIWKMVLLDSRDLPFSGPGARLPTLTREDVKEFTVVNIGPPLRRSTGVSGTAFRGYFEPKNGIFYKLDQTVANQLAPGEVLDEHARADVDAKKVRIVADVAAPVTEVLLFPHVERPLLDAPAAPDGLPDGRWNAEFANGVAEVCEFRKDGTASVAEPRRAASGKVSRTDDGVVIVFDDDRVERWTRVRHQTVVEHWYPASEFPSGKRVLGIARRADSATAPNSD